MKNTKIEWCDHSWNPWIGCTKVSPGCQHCYAEALMDGRFGRVQWGPQGERKRTSAAYWRKPLAWNKDQWGECAACYWRGSYAETGLHQDGVTCPRCGELAIQPTRQRVFCASLADAFEDRPELIEWRWDLFQLIETTPNLDWLLLTKRPENVMRFISREWRDEAGWGGFPGNVWIGTSVENQEQANRRIPELLKIPAAVRFLSIEPLLGPVSIAEYYQEEGKGTYSLWIDYLDWVIVGGESGPNARPMHPQWVRSIRDQCVAADVPFLFKQWGEWLPSSHVTNGMSDHGAWSWPWATGQSGDLQGDTTMMVNVGKHTAGRLLDGREWNEYPTDEILPVNHKSQ